MSDTDWIEKVHEFGVTKLSEEEITEEDVKNLEKYLGSNLPSDYRHFFKEYGVSDFESWVTYPTVEGGVSPGTFVGLDIYQMIDDCSGRLPKKCIPINDDGGGNLIVMSLNEANYGSIYFQHHSIGVGDKPDTDTNRWETLSFLANNFAGFIDGLESS
jgi:hypothetical protein